MIKLMLQRYRLTKAFEFFYESGELEQAGFTVVYEVNESKHQLSIHNLSKKIIFTFEIKPTWKNNVNIDHFNFDTNKKFKQVDPGIWTYKDIKKYMIDSVKEEEV